MRRPVKSRGEGGAAVLDAPRPASAAMSFKLWDTFGATDVAPENTEGHAQICKRSYGPESE